MAARDEDAANEAAGDGPHRLTRTDGGEDFDRLRRELQAAASEPAELVGLRELLLPSVG